MRTLQIIGKVLILAFVKQMKINLEVKAMQATYVDFHINYFLI